MIVRHIETRERVVVGAGPAGLAAALTLARAGERVCVFKRRAQHAEPGWIIATGPPLTDCTAQGYVFPTALEDQARAIISREVTPFGYAYLLVWDGWATLAACLLDPKAGAHGARERAAAAFQRAIPGLDLSGARPFLGRGCLLRRLCPTDEAGRLYAGEAAGLQDPVWGFGLRYALESGVLAAHCLLEGLDYRGEVRRRFGAPRRTGFFNRLVFRSATGAAVERMLFWVGARGDARRRLARFCASGWAKPLLGRGVEVEAWRRAPLRPPREERQPGRKRRPRERQVRCLSRGLHAHRRLVSSLPSCPGPE